MGWPVHPYPPLHCSLIQEIKDVTTYIKNFRADGWVEPEPIQAALEPVQIEGESGTTFCYRWL